jgi:ribose transport system permease protein
MVLERLRRKPDLSVSEVPNSLRPRPLLLQGLEKYGLALALLAMVIIFSAVMPHTFGTLNNLRTILGAQTVVLVLTLALLLTLTAGDFDLSISANLVLTATVVALIINDWHWNPALAVLAGIVIATFIGLLNGILVVKVGLNGFITTLAMMTAGAAIALGISNQNTILLSNTALTQVVSSPVLSLPADCFYTWALVIIIWYVFERTALGRHLRVTGTSREAGRLMGLPISGLRISAYVLAGALVGFASFLLIGTIGAVDPTTSSEYLLGPFAAAYLGSAAIKLGRFNVMGSLVAVYIVVVGSTGLQLLGLSAWIGQLFSGLVLLAGLLLARMTGGRDQFLRMQT